MASGAEPPKPVDPLCAHIAAFANATEGEATHTVVFRTDWSAMFSGKPDALAKSCDHAGYAPGATLCRYLIGNTSTEFALLNFNRVLACITPQSASLPVNRIRRLDIALSVFDAPGVKPDVEVGLAFSSTTTAQPVLTLSATGVAP
jgi:hypothetical protein